jgi:Glycoside hydrolase 123, catalytic domain
LRKLAWVVCLCLAVRAEAGVARIWAVNDGEKVERDDRTSPLAAGNSAWDGTRVRLFGARNEIVAFQVVVEADGRGIAALRASLPELASGDSRIVYAPPVADPTDSVGRPIQLATENYMNVTAETHADWAWKPGSPAAPGDTLGWKPVQLVPENARRDRGGLPTTVAAHQNQALWIEVYTGHDRPAGVYRGVLSVDADGSKTTLPVELEVLDFTLRDANTLDAMVYYEPDQAVLYQGRNLDAAYDRFAHRQRIEFVHAYDEAGVRAHMGRFSGADFTKEKGYEGPGEGVGNRIVPPSFYGTGPGWEDRASAWKKADAWVTFLEATLPRARSFLYMPDEPYPGEYPHVLKLAGNVHSNPGPGRKLPVFVTKHWVPELDPAIDIWCAGPQWFDVERAAKERARGRQYWTYNGGRPNGPAFVIDAPATDPRAMGWAAFKHGIEVYFYWHGVHWQHNRQKQGERRQDVWANPVTFDNRGQPNKPLDDQGYLNGDGVLLYPGEELLHPEQDRGIPGPVSSIQLANLRRGLQDHQYLTLARELGLNQVVDEALAAVVPRVFSEAGASVGFAESGDVYETARLKLGRAIAGAKR